MKSYSFKHGTDDPNNSNPYGLISQITYPTGAWVKYSWMINPQSAGGVFPNLQGQAGQCYWRWGKPALQSRTVSFDGVNPALTQTFQYPPTSWGSTGNSTSDLWNTKQTIVTTQDLVRGTSFTTTYLYAPTTISGEPAPVYKYGGFTADPQIPVEQTVTYQDVGGATLETVNKTWYNAQQMESETDTLNGLTSETTYTYGPGGQVTQKEEYDFGTSGPGRLLRNTVTNYQSFADTPIFAGGPSIFDLPCQTIVYDGNSNRYAETDYYYDGGTTLCPSTASTQALPGTGSYTGHDETNYGPSSTNPRGNMTQKTEYSSTGTSPTTTYTYDETGQILSMTDPCGNGTCSDMPTSATHTTNYSYTDSYTGGTSTCTSSNGPEGNTNAFLTLITYPPTNGVAHSECFSYIYSSGELSGSKDENEQLTTYLYNDPLARLTQANYPDGGQTSYSYNDSVYNASTPSPSVTTTETITSTLNKVNATAFDGMNHKVKTILSSDPAGATYTATTYDGNGRAYQVYNPTHCSSITTNCDSETTWGVTTTTYDALGRVTSVSEPDHSVVTTTYDQTNANSPGLCTTVTDEAGNSRQSCADGLGRVTSIWEAPTATGYNFETVYAYDALNDLLSVTQEGGSTSTNWRVRSFAYDSLSRLTSATNPESGTIAYSYDANGNVTLKTAPLENQTGTGTVQTTYAYDALNRLTKKSYNDGGLTPTVQFAYDASSLTGCTVAPPALTDSYPIGRRTSMCDGSGGTSWSHDPLGRILVPKRLVASASPHALTYTYNLDGSVATQNDGSGGKTITYTTGGAGLPLAAQDGSGNMFVKSALYAPFGGLASMINGYTSSFAGITTSNQYNSRLQPSVFSASTPSATIFSQSYSYGGTRQEHNNGNVSQIVNNLNNSRTQNFTYDPLNRILTAASQATSGTYCWGQNFSIDPWGNLNQITSSQCTAPPLSQTSSTKNQFVGFCYDAAGNLLDEFACPPPTGSHTFVYDAEGRLLYTAGNSYLYDGDGERVAKCTSTGQSSTCPTSSTGTIYFRNLGGESAVEEDLSGNFQNEYIFFNGNRVVRSDSSFALHYYFHNHLMTTEVVTNPTGSLPPQQDVDYTPYGTVIYGTPSERYLFTGKERDAESGLDNFGARYDASSLGRFMTPDPDQESGIDNMGDPQMWNGYAYVGNNPLSRTDPSGRIVEICDTNGLSCQPVKDQDYAQAQQQDQYNHAPSLDQVKQSQGDSLNITDSNGNVVGTVTYMSNPGTYPTEGIQPLDGQIIGGLVVGWGVGKVFGALGVITGWSGRGAAAAGTTAGEAGGEAAGQLGVRAGGVIERVFQTPSGPVQVYCKITAEGDTAVVKELAIYPANSEGALNVGTMQMRQGLRAIQGELKEAGFTEMRIEPQYRVGGANAGGYTPSMTVKLR
ncbi:MAG: RHS repeat-associated core domain-containing protein [Candidatus Sulfotelmatobacter sp.]